jgi:hypothetical protein
MEPRKAHGKSRVTNRPNELFVEPVDKRSAAARPFKDVLAAIVSDLGGADRLSEGQKQLCRRCDDQIGCRPVLGSRRIAVQPLRNPSCDGGPCPVSLA